MARFRVYLKPFDGNGDYLSDYIEVTKDVISLGSLSTAIENSEYDVGVLKNSNSQIKLRNDSAKYSSADDQRSIFRFVRKNSQIKITWDLRDYDLISGFFESGFEPLGGEVEIFHGLLNDISSYSDISSQQANLNILGFESLLSEVDVPFSAIADGDLVSDILYEMLNQAPFNQLVTVSLSNILPSNDVTIDLKASLEGKTVASSLGDLLLISNSVLYIKNDIVYVSSREPSAVLEYTFRGQASERGKENIINIPKLRDGINRLFNYWIWGDTTILKRDVSSIQHYGIKQKNISIDVINDTSTAKIQSILQVNRDEFSFPKAELDLETPLNDNTLDLNILALVNIDYPTSYAALPGEELPRYGLSIYGVDRYPFGQWSLTINSNRRFKILGKKLDPIKQTITFNLRETEAA